MSEHTVYDQPPDQAGKEPFFSATHSGPPPLGPSGQRILYNKSIGSSVHIEASHTAQSAAARLLYKVNFFGVTAVMVIGVGITIWLMGTERAGWGVASFLGTVVLIFLDALIMIRLGRRIDYSERPSP
ncbi:MAG: hypothetical protein LBE83_04615 [Propionibacteriaceae bacterium]|jgi:hypothetical protein|nr:hypothetical protein [Propionibacteriaceae bacterium]